MHLDAKEDAISPKVCRRDLNLTVRFKFVSWTDTQLKIKNNVAPTVAHKWPDGPFRFKNSTCVTQGKFNNDVTF